MSTPEASAENTAIEDKELSKDDVFSFINDETDDVVDDKKVEKPEKKADKTEDKDEDKDEKEDEEEDGEEDELKALEEELEELEEPGEDKLELVAPVRRREILKKYPELFKDFPYLEKAYYREQQFTEVFPTINEAKSAAADVQTLANFTEDIIDNGNTANILKLIKENNPNKFNEVCDNYLENLAQIDKGAHDHVVGNLLKYTIAAMYDEGKTTDNDGLKEAAVILNQYAFGSSKYKPPTKLAKETSEADKRQDSISEREKGLIKQSFDNAASDVATRVNNLFQRNIEANIDPKQSMTDYVRKKATSDALDKVQDLISKDARFKTLVDKLWQQAAKENFSKVSTDKIKKAFIAKGNSLLAPVVKSARNEALRGMGKRVSDKDKDTDLVEKTQEKEPERRRSSTKPKANEIPKGMSSLDYLSQE